MRWTALILLISIGASAHAFDPVAAHTALLNEAEGAFKAAGGTGGQGGQVVYIQNLNDSGAGSMRECLTRSGPTICLFENGVNGKLEITSGKGIYIKSHKTKGGGRSVLLSAPCNICVTI